MTAVMKSFHPILVVVLAMSFSSASHGAQQALRWQDGALCEFETKFDPTKYDEESLRNTVNVIFGDGVYESKSPQIEIDEKGGRLRTDTAGYERTCELTKEKATNLRVIALPGIEEYRRLRLEELDDSCWFGSVESRAASGEPSALREYTPSAATCSRFIDALEGKTDLRAVWLEVINSTCQKVLAPRDKCRADALKKESGPNAGQHIQMGVLEFGWGNCSVPYLKTSDLQKGESMRKALEKTFRRRFKVKAFPCAD